MKLFRLVLIPSRFSSCVIIGSVILDTCLTYQSSIGYKHFFHWFCCGGGLVVLCAGLFWVGEKEF